MLCVMWSDTAFYTAVAAPIGEPDTLLDVRRLAQGAERELAGGEEEVSPSWASCLLGFTFVGTVLQLLVSLLVNADCNFVVFSGLNGCLFALGGFHFSFSVFYLSKSNVEDIGFLDSRFMMTFVLATVFTAK